MAKYYTRRKLHGDRGANLVEGMVLQMGFIWRPVDRNDLGIDGWIELCSPRSREARGELIGVQVKSRESRLPGETETGFHWLCRSDDVAYWLACNIPVVLIVVRTTGVGTEAYAVDVKRYFAGADVPPRPRIRFDKSRDRFGGGTAEWLHRVVANASDVPPPRSTAALRADAAGTPAQRTDIRWPGYLPALWWLYRWTGKLLAYRQRLQRRRWIGLLERLRCLDEADRQRIAGPVAQHERFRAGFALAEGVRAGTVRLTAAFVSLSVAVGVAPRLSRLQMGGPAPSRGEVTAGLAVLAAVTALVGIPVLWHRARRVRPPGWLNRAVIATGTAFLAGVMTLTGALPLLPTGDGFRRAGTATMYALLVAAGGYSYLRPLLERVERSRLADAERRRPEVAIVHRLLEVLERVDEGKQPWETTASRRSILRLMEEIARLLERDAARRLRPGAVHADREWRLHCRGMAAHLRRLAGAVALPGAATQERLQREIIAVLVPAAAGEWKDVPTSPPPSGAFDVVRRLRDLFAGGSAPRRRGPTTA